MPVALASASRAGSGAGDDGATGDAFGWFVPCCSCCPPLRSRRMSVAPADAIKHSTGRRCGQRRNRRIRNAANRQDDRRRCARCIAAASAASAQDFASLYSSTAARNCKKVDAAKNGEGDWTIWLCPGIGGYVVRVTEDDLRMTVSIGRDLKSAADAPASKRQFAPFNSVHDTLEWRMTKGAPFATIQRWFLSDASNVDKAGKPAQVAMLVVTRLNPACHVALCRRARQRHRQCDGAQGRRRACARLRLQQSADGHRQARPRHRARDA